MIQTSFFPQPEKDEPIKIIQIAPSGLQPKKLEELVLYRGNIPPDTYMIYPNGGYHPFYKVPNTPPRYQLPIWPCVKRIKYNERWSTEGLLCAKKRKGHFEGVLSVMNRLFHLIKSKYVFMGEKDYQQLFLIKKYLSKKYNIKIINCPIIRDKNRLALSTRNILLNKKNYFKACSIANYLSTTKKKLDKKNLSPSLKLIIKKLENLYQIKMDYLEVRNEKNLKNSNLKNKYRLFVAYYIGKIRLIDNF